MIFKQRLFTILLGLLFATVLTDQASALYDPGVGRFCSRDPIGYVDGMNSYENYFLMWGVDPNGNNCQPTRCINRCRILPSYRRGILGGNSNPRQQCIDECNSAADKFMDWYNHWLTNNEWHRSLPDCPCDINCTKTYVDCESGYKQEFEYPSVCAPKGFSFGFMVTYPFYLQRYHPGAWYDLRSDDVPRTQCTYSADGKLITNGPGIGTVDWSSIWGSHLPSDVAPVDLIILLEGGRLRDGCWFELYKKVRPLKNGNNCAKNPR